MSDCLLGLCKLRNKVRPKIASLVPICGCYRYRLFHEELESSLLPSRFVDCETSVSPGQLRFRRFRWRTRLENPRFWGCHVLALSSGYKTLSANGLLLGALDMPRFTCHTSSNLSADPWQAINFRHRRGGTCSGRGSAQLQSIPQEMPENVLTQS